MLKSYFFLMLFFAMLLISCKNETVVGPTNPSAPVIQSNTPPHLFAGADINIVFPLNSCTLKGSVQYAGNIQSVSWKKISGPASFVIENPASLETKLSNLEKGAYEFELSITNKAGLKAKDTVTVTVLKGGTGNSEMIFKDLNWSCPMGCHLYIENLDAIFPGFIIIKVYLKRDHSTQWVEVVDKNNGFSKYTWTIYNNGLEIVEDQTEHPEDTPDVKIVF